MGNYNHSMAGEFHHPDMEILKPESLVSQYKWLRQTEASKDEAGSQRTGARGVSAMFTPFSFLGVLVIK